MDLILIGHSTQKQQNIHSSVHMEYSGQITHWTTKWALINLRLKIISSTFSYHNTMRLEINWRGKKCKKHTLVEAKQYATKQSMDHWRNQRGNQKTPRDKWKQKSTAIQNLWETAKAVLRGKCITAIQSYLRKQEKSQIHNLTLH